MKDRKVREKEFKTLEMSIERLKKAEIELAELKPPRDIFGQQIESIMSKLKNPSNVDEVEQELAVLRGQVKQYEESQRQVAKPQEASTKSAPQRPSYHFPRELEELYNGIEFIGSGGFARVFRAKRRADGLEVAIKVPINMDASTGKSFVREINAWQKLKHMNIVRLYDLNILPIPYLEMELCSQSLHELPKPLEIERAAGMMFHIAEGVKYAHSRGINHRDLKPQNILFQGETPKIGDWGLSRVVAESTSSARFAFSPIYVTPEQLSPQQFGKPDDRTDIYQLGTIFYELVTGRPPFKGDNLTELMAQIVVSEPIGPSSLNPASSAVEHVIMQCLRKQMAERYQSVAEMQKDLAEYLKVEYKDSLTKSKSDMRRSGYYCHELCLVHLTRGDLGESLKYAVDLRNYASEGVRNDLDSLISEIEIRRKEDLGATDELIEKAAIILHQIKMGR